MIALKFDTQIKGSSQVQNHEDWIQVDGINFAVARTITNAGSGVDRDVSNPSFPEVQFTKGAVITL